MSFPQEIRDQKDYISYMLRIWRDGSGEGPVPSEETQWRASLQSPRTGRRVAFANLEELFFFLRSQAGLELQVKDK